MSMSKNLLRISRFAWISPAVGLCIAAARLVQQGQSDLYTQTSKQFYVPGGLTGWQLAPDTFFWLGKDALGLLGVTLAGAAVFGWLAKKLKKSKTSAILSVLAVLAALPALATPALLLLKTPPSEAVVSIPSASEGDTSQPGSFASGTPGHYEVAPYKDNLIVAQVSAGGDTFDVKLPNPTGSITFNPTHIDTPSAPYQLKGSFSVALKGLSTGIELRDDHARGYLKADQFQELKIDFKQLTSHGIDAAQSTLKFSLKGTLSIMGKTLDLPIEGTLRALPPDQVSAEGLPSRPAFLLNATLALPLPQTPLSEHLAAFDKTEQPVPIRAVFVIQLSE